MNDDELTRKLNEISRGLFINRCLMIFVAVCLGILLFLPRLAHWLAEAVGKVVQGSSSPLSFVLAVGMGIGIPLAVVAYIRSRIAPKPPEAERATRNQAFAERS